MSEASLLPQYRTPYYLFIYLFILYLFIYYLNPTSAHCTLYLY